jgi:alpha-galactosidase
MMMGVAQVAWGISPTAEELALGQRWTAGSFRPGTAAEAVGLTVLANNDPVMLNSRGGVPLTIGETKYARGLFCHAVSKVRVTLPGPAASFSATVGVDNNEMTSGGRGSVVFIVSAGGKELFRSPVMHGGGAGVPVNVALGGATEMMLDISDNGDGIACDQSDWADAKVTLQDGKEVWLGDLTILPSRPGGLPFSFLYGNTPSGALLPGWTKNETSEKLDAQRTRRTLTWTDPATGLEVRCARVEYSDFPTVEWTVYFKNTGKADTPLLEQVRAVDALIDQGTGDYQLHHFLGSSSQETDYQPQETRLGPGSDYRLGSSGRPTDPVMPCFNLAQTNGGTIVALGWPGNWTAQFTRDGNAPVRLVGGQGLAHFVLHPGEEVRTPLVVVQFYSGDWIRGQNLWRRWMIAHNLPRIKGELPRPDLMACSSGEFAEMINANEANQMMFIDRFVQEKIPIEYWWMDAGWYPNQTGWPNTGTWEVDTKRFPNGLRAITDHGHALGVKSIVWFEPERVTPGTWLWDNHPEWLLGTDTHNRLLNLGNPEARAWLTDHIDKFLTDQGIDYYRQDFNIDPLGYWREGEAADRQGITENHYVTGYLAYWDALLQRHPAMRIDSCASGGRRNDLETLRRATPLLRSDYQGHPASQQGQTYGLAMWAPYFGTGMGATNQYEFRSLMCPHNTTGMDMRVKEHDFDLARRLFAERARIVPYWYGDFYPLSAYSLGEDAWMAWQLDRPESGDGVVQVFKRFESTYETARYQLRGLEAEARYRLTNLDDDAVREVTGRELMETGLVVTITTRPAALVLFYKKIAP